MWGFSKKIQKFHLHFSTFQYSVFEGKIQSERKFFSQFPTGVGIAFFRECHYNEVSDEIWERMGKVMNTKAAQFFEMLKTKRVWVVGMGVSHFDLIKLFLQKGIDVTVVDRSTPEQIGENYTALKKLGAKFQLGEGYLDGLEDECDILFRTPGMYFHMDRLTQARKAGVVVTSEMECFFDLCPCKTYAVTGSDGKTTTTTLISEMLKASGKKVWLGGNIGKALLPIIEQVQPEDRAVVELSSFQLLSMRQPVDVSVVTNLSPNHLNVHKTMEEYTWSKTNIFAHSNAFSKTVLNLDNDITRSFAPQVRGRVAFFSRKEIPYEGSYLKEDGMLCRVHKGKATPILHMEDIKIPGMHNVENYLTAIAAVSEEVSDEVIVQVAKTFGGVEHRIELVRTLDGVRYYNDSIATSPTRTIAGLRAFHQKLIVIAGGYDKHIPYEPLAKDVVERVKLLILLGATGPKIKAAVTGYEGYTPGNPEIITVNTLEEAVQTAREHAVPGDVVTLSPASASFDLYKNFEQRGHHFKKIVNSLE